MGTEDLNLLKKRLLYQSQHRGMREMDLLLGQFAVKHLPFMDEPELKQFEILLTYTDEKLYGWFFKNDPLPKDDLSSFIQLIISKAEL